MPKNVINTRQNLNCYQKLLFYDFYHVRIITTGPGVTKKKLLIDERSKVEKKRSKAVNDFWCIVKLEYYIYVYIGGADFLHIYIHRETTVPRKINYPFASFLPRLFFQNGTDVLQSPAK